MATTNLIYVTLSRVSKPNPEASVDVRSPPLNWQFLPGTRLLFFPLLQISQQLPPSSAVRETHSTTVVWTFWGKLKWIRLCFSAHSVALLKQRWRKWNHKGGQSDEPKIETLWTTYSAFSHVVYKEWRSCGTETLPTEGFKCKSRWMLVIFSQKTKYL